MKATFIFLLLITFISCGDKGSKNFNEKYALPLSSDVLLKGEVLPIDILDPTGIVAVDTFIVFIQRHEEDILRVYSSNTYKFLGCFLRKGNGPDEVLLFSRLNQFGVENNQAKLWIQSYPKFMGLLNINESLKKGRTVFDKKYSFVENAHKNIFMESNVVFNLSDSVFLLTKDPVRSQTIETNPNQFFVKFNYYTNQVFDTIYINDLKKAASSEMLMVQSCYQSIKPDLSKVVLFYSYMDAFSVVDLKIDTTTKVGLSDQSLDFNVARTIKKDFHYEACSTDSLVFGLKKDEKTSMAYLSVFDWNGDSKYRLNLGVNVTYFSVNEKTKMLYCSDIEDKILAYKLDSIL